MPLFSGADPPDPSFCSAIAVANDAHTETAVENASTAQAAPTVVAMTVSLVADVPAATGIASAVDPVEPTSACRATWRQCSRLVPFTSPHTTTSTVSPGAIAER